MMSWRIGTFSDLQGNFNKVHSFHTTKLVDPSNQSPCFILQQQITIIFTSKTGETDRQKGYDAIMISQYHIFTNTFRKHLFCDYTFFKNQIFFRWSSMFLKFSPPRGSNVLNLFLSLSRWLFLRKIRGSVFLIKYWKISISRLSVLNFNSKSQF